MIEIKQVTKKFGKVVAIDNLSLNIEQGIYGLVGQNGAGKSTLFRSICGVYEQDSGEIKIDGFDADSKAGKELVFFLSDDPYVEKSDKINDMLEFYGIFYNINKKKFNKLVSYFGLPYDKPLSKFSKGMKRQAFISLALAVETKYLLLDEAFDGLDPVVLERIKDELLDAKENGKVIVISSHNISSLEKLVDTFILITKGRLSNKESNERFGQNFVKYQALFQRPVVKEEFENAGLKVVSFKKYGSLYNIVLLETDNIDQIINGVAPTALLERIPIDAEEIVKLSMIIAREEERDDED